MTRTLHSMRATTPACPQLQSDTSCLHPYADVSSTRRRGLLLKAGPRLHCGVQCEGFTEVLSTCKTHAIMVHQACVSVCIAAPFAQVKDGHVGQQLRTLMGRCIKIEPERASALTAAALSANSTNARPRPRPEAKTNR